MRKFKIPKPESTTNKTIRFPNSVIDAVEAASDVYKRQVEEAIRGTECTFSAFVIEATRVALENLLEEETSKEE